MDGQTTQAQTSG